MTKDEIWGIFKENLPHLKTFLSFEFVELALIVWLLREA